MFQRLYPRHFIRGNNVCTFPVLFRGALVQAADFVYFTCKRFRGFRLFRRMEPITDFVEAVKALTETDPQAPWTFICDGLNTHKSEALVRFVAEACVPGVELGKKGKTGILKSMKSRADFLHDSSHRIRFVYTPKHSSWMNQIEIWFGIINRKLLKRKSYLSIEELEASILRFIEQYNLTAHPFKWTYAGIPLAI